jgi:hypothetical protein
VPPNQKGVNFETQGNSFADESKSGFSHLWSPSLLSHSTPPCSSHHPYLYFLWGRTIKKTWVSQDWIGKMGSPWWEGNDLKAPNERTPYLSPSGDPLGTPSHVWCSFASLGV